MTPTLWGCFAFINLLTFVMVGMDKYFARQQRRRIPESTLLSLAALGGAPLMLCAMYLFHHKTRKPKFYLGVPALLILQIALLILIHLYI